MSHPEGLLADITTELLVGVRVNLGLSMTHLSTRAIAGVAEEEEIIQKSHVRT